MILKYICGIVAILYLIQFSWKYINSDDFQKYGDDHKAQWTCKVNMVLGGLSLTMSNYEKGLSLYERTMKRCPEGSVIERATFNRAKCLENLGRNREAVAAYKDYIKKFKKSIRLKIALRSIDVLSASY